MVKNKKQAAVGFIFITILIDVIGFGIIIPVVPQLLQDFYHITDRTNVGCNLYLHPFLEV